MRKLRRSRGSLFVLVGILALGITLGAYAGNVLHSLELKTVDARFGLRGSEGTPSGVAVVEIDDVTFNDLRNSNRPAQWPFPRRYHARVIDQVAKGNPKAIAIDIQFTEQTTVRDDNALVRAVAAATHVVLATTEVDANGRTAVLGGDAVLKQIGARAANAVVPADSDGVIRRAPFELNHLKSFGVVTAEVAGGRPLRETAGASPWIDFAGPPGTVASYSFSRVMDGRVPPSAFRGKVVVIGPSASSLQDVHATSASGREWMSGAEIQANAVNTALHDFPLRSPGSGWGIALIVLLGLVAPLASVRLSGWRPPAAGLGAGAVYAVATQVAFDHGRVLLFTYPLAAMLLSSVGILAAEYVLEAFDRVRTHDAFSRFVPEAVVDQVLARTDGQLRLGGERVMGTVMFTDLRGFTTFSEQLSAEEVIDLLNGYLSEMSDAVLAHGGTLISYLGDGLMAIFGAPLPQPDHADRALAAAREMLEERLPRFNESLRARGFERGFKMGIGINTASRVEGMTKGTPYALFLAESTRDALTREPEDIVYVDELAVRGRSQTIKLWSLSTPAVLKEDWESEGAPPAAEAAPTVVST